MGALKYGIFGFIDSHTISPSVACMNFPISRGGQIFNILAMRELSAYLGPALAVHSFVGSFLDLWYTMH